MRVEHFVDEYNVKHGNHPNESDHQAQYALRLTETQDIFDSFVATRERDREDTSEESNSYRPIYYKPVLMGHYIVMGESATVVVQPSRRMLYRRTNRIQRRLGVFALSTDQQELEEPFFCNSWEDNELGGVALDSRRTRAIPSSVGLLLHFRELLDEVVSCDTHKIRSS